MNNTCPSCNHDKPTDKPLCFFCYFRGELGAMILVTLKIFDSKYPNRLSIEQFIDEFNAFTRSLDPVHENYPLTRNLVKKLFTHYTRIRLITASKERIKRRGRPSYLYRIGKRGKERLLTYSKRWRNGKTILVLRPDRKRHHKKKFRMTIDFKERASTIRGNLLNPELSEKELYAFLFPQRKDIAKRISNRKKPLYKKGYDNNGGNNKKCP